MSRARERTPRRHRRHRGGFTLVEMLVVIGIIGILAGMLLPSLARAKAKAQQTKCLSNLRQLGLALRLYVDEHGGEFPPRRRVPNAWPTRLQPFFLDWKIITCPSDRFPFLRGNPTNQNPNRSFIINGFNDFFVKTLSQQEYQQYQQWRYPQGMKEAGIPRPSETILFGEKRTGSMHVHMDIDQGQRGNDFEQIEHQRHGRGSNFAFGDQSVRLLTKYQELYPENLWAVREEFRYPPAPPK